MSTIEKLSKFGTVKTCKIIRETLVSIVLTDGFSTNARDTFDFMKVCMESFPEYPIMETCITDENLAIIVLVKK